MTIEQAIETVEYARAFNNENTDLMRALDVLINCAKSQQEAEKNEPLTMKEIMERKGKPLWYQFQDGRGMWSLNWAMASQPLVLYLDDGKEHIDYKTPYRDWLTYDRPPKEAHNV